MALSWLIILCVTLLLYLGYKVLFAPFRLFQNHGIKGPPPLPLVGNFPTRYKMGYMKFQEYLTKEYGPVVGFYLGYMPMLKVTDVDMLKEIFVKEFDSFRDRPHFPELTREPTAPKGLLSSQGEEWKMTRNILSPTFSAAKMRAMMPLIEKSTDTLVEMMEKLADSNESVDVTKVYGRFTMETILATGFGRSVEVQKGESDEIVEGAKEIFQSANEKNSVSFAILMPLLRTFPWLEPILRYLVAHTSVAKASKMLVSVAKQLVLQRRETTNPHKYKDLLQLMMDATSKPDGGDTTQQKLTDDQIVAHSATFMLAGYETTSTALSYVSYLLALNPTVQEKLQQEIDGYFKSNPETPLYDAAQEIEYLDKVVLETLRLHSPGGALLRYCKKTVVINGVTIPKGVSVTVPIHVIHKDPKYWKDPDVFDPERFSSEEKAKRPPLSYMPFGYGPRNCIGMRLALLETKLALIQLLRKFKFVQVPETEVPLQVSFGITVAPKHGVFLRIAKRG